MVTPPAWRIGSAGLGSIDLATGQMFSNRPVPPYYQFAGWRIEINGPFGFVTLFDSRSGSSSPSLGHVLEVESKEQCQRLGPTYFLRPVESSSSMLFASLVPFSRRRVSKRSEAQTVARARSRVGVLAMSNSVEDGIIVELDGDEIVVWKPGTVFLIAFKKPDHQRHLVVARSWLADFTSKPLAEFRALAARAGRQQGAIAGMDRRSHLGQQAKQIWPPGA